MHIQQDSEMKQTLLTVFSFAEKRKMEGKKTRMLSNCKIMQTMIGKMLYWNPKKYPDFSVWPQEINSNLRWAINK